MVGVIKEYTKSSSTGGTGAAKEPYSEENNESGSTRESGPESQQKGSGGRVGILGPGGFFGYTSLRDMIDGGGPGTSGETFVGPLARIPNMLGINPMGAGGSRTRTPYEPSPYELLTRRDDRETRLVSTASPVDGAVAVGGTGTGTDVGTGTNVGTGVSTVTGAALTAEEVNRRNIANSQVPSYAEGGTVGPGGQPIRPDGSTLQMPQNLLGMMRGPGAQPMGQPQTPGLSPATSGMTPQQVETQAQQFVRSHPEQTQQIQQAIQGAMQSGELTPQELNTMVQMATVAIQNPQMYPQLRAIAIQQGLAEEQDLSPEIDYGLLFTLLVVGKAAQGGAAPQGMAPQGMAPQGGAPQGMAPQGGQAPVMSMRSGGALPSRSPNPDGAIPIKAHEGEYVVPADVVRAKGTEFFDKLVMGYRQSKDDTAKG